MQIAAQERIAKILRCPSQTIFELEKKMEAISGKKGVFEALVQENSEIIADRLNNLAVKNQTAEEISHAILKKISKADKIFTQKLGNVSAAKI